MQASDYLHEVKEMYQADWRPDEIAQGEYWLEIEWRHEDSENRFMMVYGKDNIREIGRILAKTAGSVGR